MTHQRRLACTTPTPNPSPAEVGFTRLRPSKMPNSGKPEFGWGGEHTECAAGVRLHIGSLRRLWGGQDAGERLPQSFDQGEHVRELFRPTPREQIRESPATRPHHAATPAFSP